LTGNILAVYWVVHFQFEAQNGNGPGGLFAIETKNAARLQPQDLRGLRSFKEDYPQSEAYLLYRGKERLMKDGILCLPCEEFLLALYPGQLIGKNL
jgi:hypothetical protein